MYAKEYGSSAFMLLVAVVVWFGAASIPVSPLEGQVGAAGFPKLLAISLGALAVVRIAQIALLGRRAGGKPSPAAAPDGDAEEAADRWRAHRRAAGMLLIGIGYVVLLPYLGYVLSIGLLLAGVTVYSGRRPSPGVAVVAIVGAILLYVIFVRLLHVPLPAGIWGELGISLG